MAVLSQVCDSGTKTRAIVSYSALQKGPMCSPQPDTVSFREALIYTFSIYFSPKRFWCSKDKILSETLSYA